MFGRLIFWKWYMVVGKYWARLVCLVLILSTEVEASCKHVSYQGREWVPERLQATMSRLSEAYCQKGGDQQIIVTSGVRKPAKQARLMLNCLRSRSCGYYANQDAAKEIQAAYDAAPQQEKIPAAAAKIAEQVSRETPCYISKHLTSYALDLERRINGTAANCQRDLTGDDLILSQVLNASADVYNVIYKESSGCTHFHVNFVGWDLIPGLKSCPNNTSEN